MSRRNYACLEKAVFAKLGNIEEYRFTVDTSEAEPYRDELVAGIAFKDSSPTQSNDVLLSVYTYNLREGFRNIELVVNVNKRDSKIALYFKIKPEPGEIPNFDDNVGDNFLGTLLDSVSGEFNGKGYVKKTRNLFRLIEKLQWKSEEGRAKSEEEKNSGSSSIVPIIAIVVAVAAVSAIVYFRLRK